jgi:hypothetical protein
MLTLSACDEPGLSEMLFDYAVEWGEGKGLISRSEAGEIAADWVAIGAHGLRRTVSGTTGDSELDAALDVAPIARSIHRADALATAGMQSRDPAKLDEAIALRPQDWGYHDQKAAILAANGQMNDALGEITIADQLVEDRVDSGGSCRGLYQNMLRNRITSLDEQLGNDLDNDFLQTLRIQAEQQLNDVNNNSANSPCRGR